MSEFAAPQASIQFHAEEIEFELDQAPVISEWLKQAIVSENQSLGFLNFIFCQDKYLHQINVAYLQHDTLTDVITFPYSNTPIEGDIFISIDRIRENAQLFKVSFEEELYRVMIHGTLHLLGYLDKKAEDQALMRKKEDYYLALLHRSEIDH